MQYEHRQYINTLLKESDDSYGLTVMGENVTSNDIESVRPQLLALMERVEDGIINTVGIQQTKVPSATVYIKEIDTNKAINGIYTGELNKAETDAISVLAVGDYLTSDRARFNNRVYEFLQDVTITTADVEEVKSLIMNNQIEFVVAGASDENKTVEETSFTLRRTTSPVENYKVQLPISYELLRDLDAQEMDSKAVVQSVISEVLSRTLNRVIISKQMLHAAKKGNLDISAIEEHYKARNLMALLSPVLSEIKTNTSVDVSFLLCSSDVRELLINSSLAYLDDDGASVLNSGIELIVDEHADFDYIIAGAIQREETEETERDSVAAPLFYSPYSSNALSIHEASDSTDLQPRYMGMMRFATTTSNKDSDEVAGTSKYSSMVTVTL